jgi:hypothetical protein
MNYQNGKIYRIDCLTTNEVYIGSTCQETVARRLTQHVSGFKQWKNTGKKYTTSYPIIERGNYNITMIELYPCNSKDELKSREGYFIRSMVCVNKQIAGRTRQDYYEDNKEHILENKKDYYEVNKEHIIEKRREYCEDNYEKILEYNREHYEANKDKINKKRREKYKQKKTEKLLDNTT